MEYWNIGILENKREKIVSSPYFYELIIPSFQEREATHSAIRGRQR